MKIFPLLIVVLGPGCNSPATEAKLNTSPATPPKTITKDTISATTSRKTDTANNPYHITTDSIRIPPDDGYGAYSKEEFNEIVDLFPTLHQVTPDHPDTSFARSGGFRDFTDKDGNKKHITFSSEAGRDGYYALYAWFLSKQNQGKELANRRSTITKIYLKLNSIFGHLSRGGTYFGHQTMRIKGYAEYAVYQYKTNRNSFKKQQSIKEQKTLYLASLKKIIEDRIKAENDWSGKDARKQAQMMLFEYVASLDSLISDDFYLKAAQEFQYSHY